MLSAGMGQRLVGALLLVAAIAAAVAWALA
jgi:hypothetical protein